jgi:hypothetical protein
MEMCAAVGWYEVEWPKERQMTLDLGFARLTGVYLEISANVSIQRTLRQQRLSRTHSTTVIPHLPPPVPLRQRNRLFSSPVRRIATNHLAVYPWKGRMR